MTRPDIDTILSRLGPSNTRCLLPEMCKSQYCQDWKSLVSYIHHLESKQETHWISEEHAEHYQDLSEQKTKLNLELIGQLSEARLRIEELEKQLEQAGVV